jgi:mono/diheme cytochrome c family protein
MNGAAIAQDDAAFYRSNCSGCHTIGGGPKVGPDLKGVTQRRDRRWLLEFMQDPKKVIDSGDAYTKSLVKAYHGMVMPRLPGVDHERAEALLDFINKQSGSAQSGTGSANATARPITAEDISRGRALFIGRRALANGGPACISCHTVSHVAPLGGGGLGPDLTQSVERLGGVSSVSAWLGSPPTPTMRATYNGRALRDNEVRELVAYLKSAGAQTNVHAEAGGKWPAASFLLISLAGGLGVLGLMELFWKNRFRAVRRPLVTKRGQQPW